MSNTPPGAKLGLCRRTNLGNYSISVMWSFWWLLHMTNLQCMLSCRDLRCFDAKYILSRFTHFCVEQKITNKSCLWRQNDKYHVCIQAVIVKLNAALIPVVKSTNDNQEGSVVVNVLKCCWWNIKFLCCQQKVSSFKFKLWNFTFHSQARASHLFPQSFIRRHFHLKFRIFHRI